ncbi:MAG TPA: DUF1778 domain-containing protein [Pirellulales bacterium]
MYTEGEPEYMRRRLAEDNKQLALRLQAAEKEVIKRAAALARTNMTDFIVRAALREAQSLIEEHERVKLTRRDSLLVLDLIENSPAPNAKLRKVALAMPERS